MNEKQRPRLILIHGAAFDAVPKPYVLATGDRSVLPEAQRMMCDGVANLLVTEIGTGHVPQVARPAEPAALLGGWLRRTR